MHHCAAGITSTHQAINERMGGLVKIKQSMIKFRVGMAELRMGVFHFKRRNQRQLIHHTWVRHEHRRTPLIWKPNNITALESVINTTVLHWRHPPQYTNVTALQCHWSHHLSFSPSKKPPHNTNTTEATTLHRHLHLTATLTTLHYVNTTSLNHQHHCVKPTPLHYTETTTSHRLHHITPTAPRDTKTDANTWHQQNRKTPTLTEPRDPNTDGTAWRHYGDVTSPHNTDTNSLHAPTRYNNTTALQQHLHLLTYA